MGVSRSSGGRCVALAAIAFAISAVPARADCPGATPSTSCPYTSAVLVGARDGGVLRFPQAVAVGPDGSVYVGDQGSHVVQVFGPDGTFRRAIGRAGTRGGELTAVGGLAVAGDNSVLAADGSNRILRFDQSGSPITSWGAPGSAVGRFAFGAGGGNAAGAGGGLAVSGQFVYVADTGNDRIQRFDLRGGQGAVVVPPGTLAAPQGLAVRGTRLLVADDQHHRLAVFDTGGRPLTSVGGQGAGPGQLRNPYDVASDAQGRVFVADDLNQRVVRYSSPPRYPYKGRWGTYGTAPGQLAYPRGIAVDGQGQVYVADTGNDRIDVYDRSGHLLRAFGASGRSTGQFDDPSGVAADASGIRAVTDAVNGRLELLNPDGSVAAVWGSPAPGPTILPDPVAVAFTPGGDAAVLDQRRGAIVLFSRGSGLPVATIGSRGSGPGQLLAPSALAVDGSGTISVADTGNQRIARFDASGNYLGAITSVGQVRGIAVAPDGSRIYVADSANKITVYGPDGGVLDEFGGTGDKLGKVNAPGQMAVDGDGDLWVADRGNNRIQRFGPNGERLLAFGARGTDAGQFIHPTGVTVDCHGTVTVTDSDNNRVQQFALAAPPAGSCAQLGPLGNPPPPKLPTLPTQIGPQLTVRVLRSSRLLSARNLPLRVGCDTACALTVTGTVTPRAKPRKGHKRVTVQFRKLARSLGAGDSAVVRPALSATAVRQLNRGLRKARGLAIQLQLTATSPSVPVTSQTQRLNATR